MEMGVQMNARKSLFSILVQIMNFKRAFAIFPAEMGCSLELKLVIRVQIPDAQKHVLELTLVGTVPMIYLL